MKTTITIIILILSAASCRPQRSAMLQTAQQSQQQFQQRQLYLWNDSLSRQWSFYTDSPFVYYPDSALVAINGYIWFDENQFRSSIRQLDQDSSLYESNSHTEQQKEIKGSGREYVVVLWIVLLLLMVCCWRMITKKPFYRK